MTYKVATVFQFEVLLINLPGATAKYHQKPQSR